jgi:putative Mg2+ transporter-C (MgtC) family protein
MDRFVIYLGDLHKLFEPHWAGSILVLVSVLCGLMIGQERESKNKPAGLRTVTLICVGSTIFTLASILIAGGKGVADPGRIAAQVVTGIGFLGAGAIIQERGTVVGLTTAATIWAVSAIGVVIGAGYAAGGIALAVVVLVTLRGAQIIELWTAGPCRHASYAVRYRVADGKARLKVLRILDGFHVPDANWSVSQEGEFETMHIRCCTAHRNHRAVLSELADLPEVVDIGLAGAGDAVRTHASAGSAGPGA